MVAPGRCPLTMIPGGLEVLADGIFPPLYYAFCDSVQVEPRLCPPHQPQKNGFVERYHRSYKEECLNIYQPESLEEVKRVTEQFQHHYNDQRPHQGRACGNQPPRQAFPTLAFRFRRSHARCKPIAERCALSSSDLCPPDWRGLAASHSTMRAIPSPHREWDKRWLWWLMRQRLRWMSSSALKR